MMKVLIVQFSSTLDISSLLGRVFQFLEYQTMDKVQKPSNPECYTPPPEPFRIESNIDEI
jgi:hypothetical protein